MKRKLNFVEIPNNVNLADTSLHLGISKNDVEFEVSGLIRLD